MMDAQRVDMFLYPNSKYFPPESISQIRDRLLAMPCLLYTSSGP